MANFTPEEISEILSEFFDVVGKRQYIGARYVPIFGRKGEASITWDNSKPYEPLTIVLYQGNSYTSRQYVPAGVDLDDATYWANTGNYNAQVESYRQEVSNLSDSVTAFDNMLPSTDFDAEHTVKDYVDTIKDAIPSTDFDAEHTVKDYVDTSIGNIENIIPSNAFDSSHTIKDYIDNSMQEVGSYGFIATAADYTDDTIQHILWTPDCSHFYPVFIVNEGMSGDTYKIIEYDGVFYAANGGYILSSTDLEHWTATHIFDNPFGTGSVGMWGAKLANLAGDLYYFVAARDNDQTEIAAYNNSGSVGTTPIYKIMYARIYINDGVITHGELTNFSVCSSNATSYIDPDITYESTGTYHYFFCAKNECTKQIEVYRGTSLVSMSLISKTVLQPLEACSIYNLKSSREGSGFGLFAECFSIGTNIFNKFVGTQCHTFYEGSVVAGDIRMRNAYTPQYLRHIDISECTGNMFSILLKKGLKFSAFYPTFINLNCMSFTKSGTTDACETQTVEGVTIEQNEYIIDNNPCKIYRIGYDSIAEHSILHLKCTHDTHEMQRVIFASGTHTVKLRYKEYSTIRETSELTIPPGYLLEFGLGTTRGPFQSNDGVTIYRITKYNNGEDFE